jgi:hypothetical protein
LGFSPFFVDKYVAFGISSLMMAAGLALDFGAFI